MALYALRYRYVEDPDLITTHRPEHRTYLRGLADAGELVVAGPLGEPGAPGGLLILDVATAARAEQIAEADPFSDHGVIAAYAVQAWTLSIGADRLQLTT